MAVRLEDDDKARTAAYWQHFCDPLNSNTSYGNYNWDRMKTNGFLVDNTHPTAYSAYSGHPTFPTHVGRIEVVPCDNPKKGLLDRTGEGGVTWQTWEGPLYDVKDQIWYGFGGGWGAKIGGVTGWGPLGPGKQMQASDAPAQPGDW